LSFDWDGFLEELDREVKEERVWVFGLSVRLLNDYWKIVSCFIRGKGIDYSLRGISMKPPPTSSSSPLSEERVSVFCVDRAQFLPLHFPLSCALPGEKIFVHHAFFDPGIVLLVLAGEDISPQLEEVLKRVTPPRRARYELYKDTNLKLVFNRFLFSFGSLLENIEPYTHHHSLRVALLASGIAHRLGLLPEKEEEVRIAGLIHDLGKLFIPREILHKPDKLTPREFEEVKRHVLELDRIFLGNEFMERFVPLARLHHERLDGSGYLGLEGEEIPLEARILAVCDVFDALVHLRPYRRAFTLEEAIQELHLLAAKGKLDGDVVRVLLAEIPEYYLAPVEGRLPFLPPGTEVRVRKAKEVYLGKARDTEGDKLTVAFTGEVPFVPGETVLILWDLSYSIVELVAECLARGDSHVFFLLKKAERRRRVFTLHWNLDIRFLKIPLKRPMTSPARSCRASATWKRDRPRSLEVSG